MNISISVLKTVMFSCFLLYSTSFFLKANDAEQDFKTVVYPNAPLEYSVKSTYKKQKFLDFPEKLRLKESHFGVDASAQKAMEYNVLTSLPGFTYAFTHPKHNGFSESDKQTIQIQDDYYFGSKVSDSQIEPAPFTMEVTAKSSKTGWGYTLKKQEGDNVCVLVRGAKDKVYKIESLTITVNSKYDDDDKRMSSATVKYSWKVSPKIYTEEELQAEIEADEAAAKAQRQQKNRNNNKKKNNKNNSNNKNNQSNKNDTNQKKNNKSKPERKGSTSANYTVRIKFENVVKKVEKKKISYSDPRTAKAIEDGKNWLLKNMSKGADGDKGKHLGGQALAWFAILRADVDISDPEIERGLLKFAADAKKAGYVLDGDKAIMKTRNISKPGYTAGCILMVIEAAINGVNTDKAVNVNDKKFKAKLRGSKNLQSTMLNLGHACVEILNANVKVQGKYGNQAKATQRGHLWAYDGSRAYDGSPHYSPAQYAVLGLRCAKLVGIPVHDNVWEDIHKGVMNDIRKLEDVAEKWDQIKVRTRTLHKSILDKSKDSVLDMVIEGGVLAKKSYGIKTKNVSIWGYRKDKPGYGELSFNMVCAALGNLALAYSFMPEKKHKDMYKKMGEGLHYCQIALEYFYRNLSMYEYYSWERVAVFYGVKKVKDVDWHAKMSKTILDVQNSTGEFMSRGKYDNHHPLMATAYAVLFLKKATRPVYRTSTID